MRRRMMTAAAVTLMGVLSLTGLVSAHAHRDQFTPGPNRVVTVAPDKLDLTFTEELKQIQVDVFNANGDTVQGGPAVIDLASAKHVTVPLKAGLPVGTYTVRWQATSVDGHTSAERYTYTVTTPGDPGAIRVFWNGQEITGDVPAKMENGRTLVPIRAVAEALGKVVTWDGDQKFVLINDAPKEHSHHDMYQHPDGAAAPMLSLTVTKDAKSGFNVHVDAANWTWAPDKVNTAPAPNEGHGHLYVDGVKVARLYGPWYHLDGLTPGQHDVRVTLNANNHAEYAVGGHVVEAAYSIVVRPDGSAAMDSHAGEAGHDHGHDHTEGDGSGH